ncbi:MAG TPA: hypothetical protein VM285_03590, partial [Polyangia bacterium]|nr:hypothetical protein [Polyangia bacterium]
EYESRAMDAALVAHARMLAAEAAIATGMTGIKELLRRSLDLGIQQLEQGLASATALLPGILARPDRAAHAEILVRTIQLQHYQLQAMKNASAALRQAAPTWLGLQRVLAYRERAGLGEWLASLDPVCGTAHAGAFDTLGSVAGSTLGAMGEAARLGVQAVATVASAAASVARGSVATASVVSKMAADGYCGWQEGLPNDQIRTQVLQTMEEHGREIQSGKTGAGAFDRAIAAHKDFENWSEQTVSSGVSSLSGDGWISWGAGKVATAAVGAFTSLGKGAMQIADPNATAGQIVEGVVNVGVTLLSGSATFTGSVQSGLGNMMSSAGSGIKNVVSKGFNALGALTQRTGAVGELAKHSAKMAGALAGSVDDAMRATHQLCVAKLDSAVAVYRGALDQLGGEIAALVPNVLGGLADGIASRLPSDLAKAGTEIVKNWTTKLSGREALGALLGKLAPSQLLGGWFDSLIAESSGRLVDTLVPADRQGLPLAAAPVVATESLTGAAADGRLAALEQMAAQIAAMAATLAELPVPAAPATAGREMVQGSPRGTFQGGKCSGSMTLTISGSSVTGSFDGSAPADWTNFTGRFVSGRYNPATGTIHASMQGSWNYYGERHPSVDPSEFQGVMRGTFTGTQRGSGFEGVWEGFAGREDRGTWSVSGGQVIVSGGKN